MKRHIFAGALAAAGLLGCASQAAADGFIITFRGHIEFGQDDTNIFGLGNSATLDGLAVTQTFIVDYAQGAPHDLSGGAFDRDYIGDQNFVRSTTTVNGVAAYTGSQGGIDERLDYHLDPAHAGNPSYKSYFGEFAGDEAFVNSVDPVSGDQLLETWDIFAGGYGQNYNYHPDLSVGPPVFTAADNLDFFGAFTISHELFDQTKGVAVYDDETTGNWTADSVTITTFASGAPEPAAWALMILGFGASGAALRRRRLMAAVA